MSDLKSCASNLRSSNVGPLCLLSTYLHRIKPGNLVCFEVIGDNRDLHRIGPCHFRAAGTYRTFLFGSYSYLLFN